MELVFSKDNLYAFENMQMSNYFQAYSKINFVVGGLNAIGTLSSIDGFYPDQSAFLFSKINQSLSDTLTSLLSSKDLDKTISVLWKQDI